MNISDLKLGGQGAAHPGILLSVVDSKPFYVLNLQSYKIKSALKP